LNDSLAQAKRALYALPFVLSLAFTVGCAPMKAGQLPDDPTHETVKPGVNDKNAPVLDDGLSNLDANTRAEILASHGNVDPTGLIPKNLLSKALAYYDRNQATIPNKAYLSVIDFAKPSNKHRLFIIEMKTGKVWALPVAHGKGSDLNNDGIAERFSNVSGSESSSLGVYRTAETYIGHNDLSLRLDGLSATNSNVRARDIVVHGASYVKDIDMKQGRSWGCPAVPLEVRDKVIGLLKGGSIILADKSF
jgi:hypothetical protein